ncbi:MAG: hypothetical protein COV66_00600 [Nitrospinae bacterium CG11_big_fil_rev_8_21_14_0_20_45_15]|nr:MAG: hypothetical protein COV66_00600 [Nitrospinae bacterium CG11_big_fil_rev_8_21_14_0_20_45_15]
MGVPELIESIGFYNLVQLDEIIFGLPMGLGAVELNVEKINKHPCAFVGKTLEEVIEKIRLNDALSKEKYEPILKDVFGFYNILGWGADLYGVPVSLGEINLHTIKISDYPGIIKSFYRDDLIKEIEEFCRSEHRKMRDLSAGREQ